jgi:segregation and condensation protein A
MAEEKSTLLAISLPRFDGPFDLLISLIRRNEWPIDDLPVLEITRQFLAYIKASEGIDSDLGGEFIETASWLVLLKSRSMLPAQDSEIPPQEELRRAVLDHAILSAATDLLRGRYDRNIHPGCGGSPVGRKDSVLPPSLDDAPTVDDVLAAAHQAIAAARAAASFSSLNVAATTIEQQTRWIANKLAAIPVNTAVSTADWFTTQPDAGARVALLLALLELSRKGFLLLNQTAEFAPIQIKSQREIPENVHVEEQTFALTA